MQRGEKKVKAAPGHFTMSSSLLCSPTNLTYLIIQSVFFVFQVFLVHSTFAFAVNVTNSSSGCH